MESLNGKINGNSISATEWNQMPSELQAIILAASQVLSSGDLDQVGKAIAYYVSAGLAYTDNGASSTAYILTRVGTALQEVPSLLPGITFFWIPGITNTTSATTITLPGVAAKSVKNASGADFLPGDLTAGTFYLVQYDSGGDEFIAREGGLSADSFSELKSGRRNLAINPNALIVQESNAINGTTPAFIVDMWEVLAGSGVTANITGGRVIFPPGESVDEGIDGQPDSYLRLTKGTEDGPSQLAQGMEVLELTSGKTVTLGLWARSQGASQTVSPKLVQDFNGGDANILINPSDASPDMALTTSWQKFVLHFEVPSIAGKTILAPDEHLSLRFQWTYGASVTSIDLTNIQPEIGDNETDFENRPPAEEYILINRFFPCARF